MYLMGNCMRGHENLSHVNREKDEALPSLFLGSVVKLQTRGPHVALGQNV